MKKALSLLLGAVLLSASCQRSEDNRFFAPEVEFGAARYSADSDGNGADIMLTFSRPAQEAFSLGFVFTGTLEEGVQFTSPSRRLDVAAGDTGAVLHIDFVDEEILDENSWIDITLVPGTRYTVNTGGRCTTRVEVTKRLVLPVLSLSVVDGDVEINPYLPKTLKLKITSTMALKSDTPVTLDTGDWSAGEEFLVNGGAGTGITIPAGETSVAFDIDVVKLDRSGYDRTVTVGIAPEKGVYGVSSQGGSLNIRLYDPVVDFSPLLKTKALNDGKGFQIRQAVKTSSGTWNGNTTVDMGVSSEGSNYLRNFRNMFDHPSFGCRANTSVSQMFRLSDFFPLYLYPNETAILDYGNDQGHREFSPADSLLRFVLDKGEKTKGRIFLDSPRTFKAYIGSYSAWQDRGAGDLAWVIDSRSSLGDIDASRHEAITGSISVTLVKLEGTFDFSDASQPVLLTAWLSSDSEYFMAADAVNGKDPAGTLGLVREDGLWKVEYRLWPR